MRRCGLVVFAVLLFPAVSWAQLAPLAPLQPLRPLAPLAPMAPIYTPPVSTRTAPVVVGSDGTYLGRLSANPYETNSTSNPYGKYGSPYSTTSVNNPYGKYGSPYSSESATNPYTTRAPKIVAPDGTYLGRLSANPYDANSTSNPYGRYGSPYSPTSVNNPYSPYYIPPTTPKK